MTISTKVRKTLTLDADVVQFYSGDDVALSTVVNEALRRDIVQQQRQTSLATHVAELGEMFGPSDPDEVEYFRELFSR
jgi:hypothetical protein